MSASISPDRRVLVTGANGFIGSHVTQHLLARGDCVRCLFLEGDLLPSLRAAEIVRADLRNADAVRAAAEGVSLIFHLGAMASVSDAAASPVEACLVNTVGTLNVLEAARTAGAHVIVLSTAHVYGRPVRLPVTEDHPLAPASVYAASKLAADTLALGYFRGFGLPVTILRPFNIYGPGQRPVAVIPSIVEQAVCRGSVEVRDTAPLRDFVYVGDVVDALLRSGDAPGAVGEEILLASGRAVSVGSVVRRVVAIASGGAPAEEEESPSLQADCVYGDAAKARALLGWTPVTDLNTGLAETVAWRRGATEGR